MRINMIGALFVLPQISAVAPAAGHPGTVSGTSDAAQIVRPIAAGVPAPMGGSPGSRKLLEAYYDSILRWGRIVAARTRPVPGVDGRLVHVAPSRRRASAGHRTHGRFRGRPFHQAAAAERPRRGNRTLVKG